ncbi:uncharacterized protein I303_103542 [Kwoniella dejecticola CBS 10117]|uniref:Nudix hydrolase domain-containing protein n=1 Tax=Kwoniella dejecticola CBS 10117 TaxID=1296121 RepID=A0A1A6A714_9TREE|nr:uncharacterized protein I303_03564 [Kwoniella dejecticola CBS 10117]OBR85850.1 hypothetical protein I303_03564 [Kwoniella dejecticola CBS 10117]
MQSSNRETSFKIHQSTTRFCLPLSKFAKLPSNANKVLGVGCFIATSTSTSTSTNTSTSTSPGTAKQDVPSAFEDSSRMGMDNEQRVLVFQRTSTPRTVTDQWETPSGKAQFGKDQTLLETVVRVTKEQTRLNVIAIKGDFEPLECFNVNETPYKQYNFIIEVGPNEQGEGEGEGEGIGEGDGQGVSEGEGGIRLDPVEHQAYKWITLDEIHHLEMSEETRSVLENGFIALQRIAQRKK